MNGSSVDGRARAAPPVAERTKATLRELYEGDTLRAYRFRYGLLVFDVVSILFIIVTSFAPWTAASEWLDILFGLLILADFAARMAISPQRWRELLHWTTWADILSIVSFLAPVSGAGAGFLRILRTLRLLRSPQLAAQLRADSAIFRSNEDVILAVVNLTVFIFVMTGLVYETQHWKNPAIGNYADALYFTVTALTTTGFGDITLPGTSGRMITVVIMFFGVTLFFRLAQVLFRPNRVRFPCPACGLQRHDHDAIHCKGCGIILNIPDEGAV